MFASFRVSALCRLSQQRRFVDGLNGKNWNIFEVVLVDFVEVWDESNVKWSIVSSSKLFGEVVSIKFESNIVEMAMSELRTLSAGLIFGRNSEISVMSMEGTKVLEEIVFNRVGITN